MKPSHSRLYDLFFGFCTYIWILIYHLMYKNMGCLSRRHQDTLFESNHITIAIMECLKVATAFYLFWPGPLDAKQTGLCVLRSLTLVHSRIQGALAWIVIKRPWKFIQPFLFEGLRFWYNCSEIRARRQLLVLCSQPPPSFLFFFLHKELPTAETLGPSLSNSSGFHWAQYLPLYGCLSPAGANIYIPFSNCFT